MPAWAHQLNECEFEWTLAVGDGQGSLACCGLWGYKESDMTERLNGTETRVRGNSKILMNQFLFRLN